MKCLLLLITCSIVVVATAPPLLAEELSGQIERIDWESVTLRGINNSKIVVPVDDQKRAEAAKFLGKTVRVEVLSQDGKFRVLKFRQEALKD